MVDEGIRIGVSSDNGAELVVVTVAGELDMASSPVLEATLEALSPGSRVVVSMAGVDFMDSSGLRVLVRHHVRLAEAGGSLRVRRPSAPVRAVLGIASLEQLLESDDERSRLDPA